MDDISIPIWLLVAWLLLPLIYLAAILIWGPHRTRNGIIDWFTSPDSDGTILAALDCLTVDMLDKCATLCKELVPQIISGGVGAAVQELGKHPEIIPAGPALAEALADQPWYIQALATRVMGAAGGLEGVLGGLGGGTTGAPTAKPRGRMGIRRD